jgi:hypothetical protein
VSVEGGGGMGVGGLSDIDPIPCVICWEGYSDAKPLFPCGPLVGPGQFNGDLKAAQYNTLNKN